MSDFYCWVVNVFSNSFTTNSDHLCYKNRKEIKDCISNHPYKILLKLFLNLAGGGDAWPSIYPFRATGAS